MKMRSTPPISSMREDSCKYVPPTQAEYWTMKDRIFRAEAEVERLKMMENSYKSALVSSFQVRYENDSFGWCLFGVLLGIIISLLTYLYLQS